LLNLTDTTHFVEDKTRWMQGLMWPNGINGAASNPALGQLLEYRWLRHEDWNLANEKAKELLQ
jgi:hypothetical protein